MQIAFISSYAAIRLWRVRYKDGACYVNAYTGAHVCRDDVAVGFPLDPARNIPPSLALAAQACMTGTEFNLLVESVEYYDDLNVVVAVRRGTIQDLAALVSGQPAGHMVFYFVHTLNYTSLIREGEPWAAADPPAVLAGSAVLCPALRFLPSLGTFFAHSAAAVFQVLASGFCQKWQIERERERERAKTHNPLHAGHALRAQPLLEPLHLPRDRPRARGRGLPGRRPASHRD